MKNVLNTEERIEYLKRRAALADKAAGICYDYSMDRAVWFIQQHVRYIEVLERIDTAPSIIPSAVSRAGDFLPQDRQPTL